MDYCIGCGRRIWTPKNENESGDWCGSSGDCEIRNFEGVNRLREAVITLFRGACQHELLATRDGEVRSCSKCHQSM